jgi:hypothetical protein
VFKEIGFLQMTACATIFPMGGGAEINGGNFIAMAAQAFHRVDSQAFFGKACRRTKQYNK